MPQLAGSAIDKATLLNLGTYTAGGLPLQFPPEITDDAQMQAYFQQWTLDDAPGQQRRYSNPSIGLLGHLTALAMNSDFADLVQTQVFPKLGLSHSFIRVPQAQMDDYAWGYNASNEPVRVNPGVFAAEAYGVKSSAPDMLRFVEANISPEAYRRRCAVPCKQPTSDTLMSLTWSRGLAGSSIPTRSPSISCWPATPTPLPCSQTRLPWSPGSPSGPRLFNKTGSTDGFGAYAAFVPDKRIGIVMLANKNFSNAARITAAHAVLEKLAAESR
ncbi:beta-lactamase [Mycobacterium ulcerans str. Harvey]|uniref:Beta-lactamase n=1 Tax=Mycobacterium ulcerans str. Harvey TaxID=1299332 RepID=A0ABN0QUV9_MYCUL|nr:beta-lactamase [Mycobacterium ulcerans str. Harvey]